MMTPETLDVVFICTGNRARSALGAALLTHYAPTDRIAVRSVGLLELGTDMPALPEFVEIGRGLGVDLGSHVAKKLATDQLRDAALVVGFERQHVVEAVTVGRSDAARTFLLGELVELLESGDPVTVAHGVDEALADADTRRSRTRPDTSKTISDPIGRSRPEMEATANQIDALVRRLSASLFPAGSTDR
jgi:protein-tyrosine-phosphatase